VLCVTLITACSGIRAGPPPVAVTAGSSPAAPLYVVRRGWHIDVGFRVDDLQPPLRALNTEFAGARYLIFGFGDRHYLMARNYQSFELLAALWPGPGLMLVTGLTASPPGPYDGSRYFGARARYSALHTCNTWAAEAIRAAGWPVHTGAVIFAGQLWRQLRHLLREDQNTASAAAEIAP